jgi:hypothetical protein
MVSVTIICFHLVGITNLSVDLISDRDLDRFETIQDVELSYVKILSCTDEAYQSYLCQIEAGVVIDRVAVLDNNKVCMHLSVALPIVNFFPRSCAYRA